MKFQVSRDVFAEAVAWTARTLPARPPVPILAGMLLEAGDGVSLASFDYEISSRVSVDADVEETGRVLVPGRLLAEIVRSLPASPVTVSIDGAEAVIRCGSTEFGLLTLPVEDYPGLPELPPIVGSVGGEEFATAVSQVAPAASRDDTLPMLTAVRVDMQGDTLTLAATDRYRVAVRELAWTPDAPDVSALAVVPAKTLADIAKSLRDSGELTIRMTRDGGGEKTLAFAAESRVATTRLLDDHFVELQSRFPKEWVCRAEVRTAAFTEAVRRVGLAAERSTQVQLAFSAGEVVVRAGTGNTARGVEVADANLQGEPIHVAFNPQYLLDGLAGVQSGTTRFEFVTPTKPAVITGAPAEESREPEAPHSPDYRYLAMPLRVPA